jgi:glyoxylase-like metal-dependent hydrolase (beta-lactamase superfamily II)
MTAPIDRRAFLGRAAGCSGWLMASLAGASLPARRLFASTPGGAIDRVEPWGRLERVADGVWMLISTPLAGDHATAMRTFSNGGLVAGREAVLAVEGFASEDGSRWLSDAALRLTGRRPTHVVLTHYHGDHAAGLGGYRAGGAATRILGTATTRDLLRRKRPGAVAPETLLPGDRATELDLGGRAVRITPRDGHTASDLTIETVDPRVVWCGDLVWIGLFPNFVDATPSRQTAHVRQLLAEPATLWVPGHGSAARTGELRRFLALLESVEDGARRAVQRGISAEVAAREWKPPAAAGDWVRFSDDYYQVAFHAWERELRS